MDDGRGRGSASGPGAAIAPSPNPALTRPILSPRASSLTATWRPVARLRASTTQPNAPDAKSATRSYLG